MTALRSLNPAQWRDEERTGRTLISAPVSGLGAALGAAFPARTLPADLQRLVDRLR